MLSADEAKLRVARGAAHLDAIRPQWYVQIDVGVLELSHCRRCILGQLFGEFYDGVAQLNLGVRKPFAFGMALAMPRYEYDIEAEWRPLQDAWIAAIADRRLAAGDNGPAVHPEAGRGTEAMAELQLTPRA